MERFLTGFAIGAAISSAAVLATSQRSGAETRQWIARRIRTALEAGQTAAAAREQQLWAEFHQRIRDGQPGKTSRKPDKET
jgi:gas vesicle protein